MVDVAGDVWSTAFKTNFVALWMHGMSHKLRISRLDPIQHEAVHGINAITTLCAALPVGEQLRIQRLVLRDPTAGMKTPSEVGLILQVPGSEALPDTFKGAAESLTAIGALGAENAARMFVYARAAWVREKVVTLDLGEAITKRQIETLLRRTRRQKELGGTEISVESAYKLLPVHATCLCICTECQRVANAHVANAVGDKPMGVFNELGVSQSMVRWHHIDNADASCLHCAKRSSAALRTAMSFQDFMRKRKIENEDVDHASLHALTAPRAASTVESGIAARVRRDAKNALEQRAVAAACADSTMLTIPMIGKALRIYDSWYTLCGYCAAVTKVTATHRYGAHVCCLRCDHQMLYRAQDGDGLVERATQSVSERVCRYCGNVDPERSGTRWRQVKAPLDVAGANATLPAPLRRVWYCPSHYRAWIAGAHRVLQTRVILAHLATNAKPVIFAETGEGSAEGGEASNAAAPAPKPKRKRRKF